MISPYILVKWHKQTLFTLYPADLFNDAVSNSGYTASNGLNINEWLIWRYVEKNSFSLIWHLSRLLSGRTQAVAWETSIMFAGLQAEFEPQTCI